MGAAILSISLELCKLSTFVSVCTCNVQIYSLENYFRAGQRRRQGRTKCQGGSESGELLWLRENLFWGCSWGGRAAVQMLNAPGEAPGASGPASALSFSSSSAWCAEKTPRVFGRGSGELRQPQRGFGEGTARWRCQPRGGGVTQRWRCHPEVPMSPSAERLRERSAELPALGLAREREKKSLFSRAVNPSPPRGFSASPSLPALPDVLSAGGCRIPRARGGESQQLLNLTTEISEHLPTSPV